MFDACRRRYYFHYYGSWGGWEKGAPALAQEAFKLKRLTSLPMWRGQLVHYVVTKILASMRAKGRIPDRNDVIRYINERFSKQLEFSEKRRYLSEPKKRGGRLNIDWLALFDHEYGKPLGEKRLDETREECVSAVGNLLGSDILAAIGRTDPDGWAIENIDLAEFAQVFDFEGAKVFAKTDFMFRGLDGSFNIVDWKTFSGKGAGDENARVQLGVYGYYAASQLGEPLEGLRLLEVNLLGGVRAVEYRIGREDLDGFYRHIREGIDKLSSVLEGGDITANVSLPPADFPKVEDNRCTYCNFYRVCRDEKYPHRIP
jgi:hypothetical protein